MPYVSDRVMHDADAHTMEPPEWLDDFASQHVIDYVIDHFDLGDNERAFAEIKRSQDLHQDPQYQANNEAEIMLRKNYRATGASDPADRSQALDHMASPANWCFHQCPTRS